MEIRGVGRAPVNKNFLVELHRLPKVLKWPIFGQKICEFSHITAQIKTKFKGIKI